MLFNTLQFAVFFAVVLALYFSLKHRGQNRMLIVASYFFYACWDWRFLSLIFISTAVDFYVGKLLHETPDQRRRKVILCWSILFNLGFLAIFKYYGFFAESLRSLMQTLGYTPSFATLTVVLPVGISFYTFQSMSYTLDIYRKDIEPSPRFSDFALSVAFFSHMVAGPIQRADSLIKQVAHPRVVTREHFSEGFYLILWGLFKKMVIADNMALLTDPIFSKTGNFTATEVFAGALAFAFQIYGDFSGYTDIARGTAKLMGFDLMLNFNLPYFATSPQDFWRRWHISLSTWLRDYLYFSLGGSRKGEVRTYVNLMLTMVLGGLWHGASWTFVIWGFYHGSLLCLHRAALPFLEKIAPQTGVGQFAWRWTRIGFMFLLTLYGWLIFRANSFSQLAEMTRALFSVQMSPAALAVIAKVLVYCALLLLVQLIQFRKNNLNVVRESPVIVQAGFYLVCFYLIMVLGAFDSQSFIYFQF